MLGMGARQLKGGLTRQALRRSVVERSLLTYGRTRQCRAGETDVIETNETVVRSLILFDFSTPTPPQE
jgi:hypothetical protein